MLLSIIIPMFNSFQMLKKSLDRLEKNVGKSFDVIVIDDLSTDNSLYELEQYKLSTNLNLTIIKNETNIGPGASRNKGIIASTSDYITFLDSDDYLSDDFFDVIIPFLNKDIDTIIFDYNFVDESLHYLKDGKSINLKNINEGFINNEPALVFTFGSTWGKIYKRTIAINNNIKFNNLYRNEDMPFTKAMIAYSTNIFYLNKSLYNYVQNANSLMHTQALISIEDSSNSFSFLKDNYIKDEFKLEMDSIYLREVLNSIIIKMIILKYKNKGIKEFIEENFDKRFIKNKYFKMYSTSIRIFSILSYYKCIFLLKLIVRLKKIIKPK